MKEPEKQQIKLQDYIFECKFESGFKQYMETNFDLRNSEKYLMGGDQGGMMTLDLVIKVFMASFVWKNIIFDRLQGPVIQERI